MRRGMNGLSLQVQEALGCDPHAGDLYVFRGGRGDLVNILWHIGFATGVSAGRHRLAQPAPHMAADPCRMRLAGPIFHGAIFHERRGQIHNSLLGHFASVFLKTDTSWGHDTKVSFTYNAIINQGQLSYCFL